MCMYTYIMYQGTFLFGMVWSVGATVGVEGRKAFNLLLREIIQGPLLPKTKSDLQHTHTHTGWQTVVEASLLLCSYQMQKWYISR